MGDQSNPQLPDDRRWMAEHRYRAVLQVLDGVPVADAARQSGASRQSVYTWLARYEEGGLDALADRSRRPHTSPRQVPAELEAEICELRRAHPRRGARRIVHEFGRRGVPAPGRSTVHRILDRHGLINNQQQTHRRIYRRWQRDAPMQLWQLGIMSGVFLANGRECKLVTGLDDHSRYLVLARVVAVPSGRAISAAFTEAMAIYGVPSEVLTDNGKQFTGRYTKPVLAEVLFERICRENGITHRLTKPRSPTTTGKIERLHKTLRRELLDHTAPFADLRTTQAAIDAWTHAYNHTRPHQALDMVTPAAVFRPVPEAPERELPLTPPRPAPEPVPGPQLPEAPADLPLPKAPIGKNSVRAVEFTAVISQAGRLCLPRGQEAKFTPALGGRTVTVWADQRSFHILLDGEILRTRPSRLSAQDLKSLIQNGAWAAGPEPAPSALPAGTPAANAVIEAERIVARDGYTTVRGHKLHLPTHLEGRQVTLRFEGQLRHVITGGHVIQTLPAPIPPEDRARISGAHAPRTTAPPPPAPPLKARRRVSANGRLVIAGQTLAVGVRHTSKVVTIQIEDTLFRVLDGAVELAAFPRDPDKPIRQFRANVKTTL